MQSWHQHCEKCVCLQGDYVEKWLHFQLPRMSIFFNKLGDLKTWIHHVYQIITNATQNEGILHTRLSLSTQLLFLYLFESAGVSYTMLYGVGCSNVAMYLPHAQTISSSFWTQLLTIIDSRPRLGSCWGGWVTYKRCRSKVRCPTGHGKNTATEIPEGWASSKAPR